MNAAEAKRVHFKTTQLLMRTNCHAKDAIKAALGGRVVAAGDTEHVDLVEEEDAGRVVSRMGKDARDCLLRRACQLTDSTQHPRLHVRRTCGWRKLGKHVSKRAVGADLRSRSCCTRLWPVRLD